MLPWWGDTLTVYHRLESKNEAGKTTVIWQSEHCKHCFYSQKQQQSMVNNVMVNETIRFARIPDMLISLNKGDIIVRGVVHDKIQDGASGKELLGKYKEAFTVNVAKDNSGKGLPLPHIYGGE